jgi:hypothetical protein
MNAAIPVSTSEILAAAYAHYATGPRPNILQYPCDYIETYPFRDHEGFTLEEGYWVPTVTHTDKGYIATVEEPHSDYTHELGTFATLAEAAFAAHDKAYDLAVEQLEDVMENKEEEEV